MIAHSRPTIGVSDIIAISKVLKSGYIAKDQLVEDFEKRFSHYIGCTDAVATNSGTSALHLSLLVLDIKDGDEVIIPSYVCTSILDAINYVRAKPVLVDIDYDTFNISLKETRRRLTNKTKAVILPHMFGLPCDVDEFLKLGIPIIEDCAQSLGARYKDRLTGSFGAVSIFSFYATKLMTTGYGGIVLSNSRKLLDRIRDLNDPDKKKTYKVRFNYKMSELQAALGIDQLKHLRYFIRRRKEIAKVYNTSLSRCDIEFPVRRTDRDHIFYRYVIKSKRAESIRERLKKNGIEVIPPVYKPLHRYLSLGKKNFPNTERVYQEAVSLPIYPTLTKKEFSKVIDVLLNAIGT